MKKLILAAVLAMFASATAYAGPGINIGVSGQLGLFAATATETDVGTNGTTTDSDEKNSESEFLGIGYASVFIEKTLGRAFIGVDYVPSALESETSETARNDKTTTDARSTKNNKVQVDFEDLTTVYFGLNVTDNMYVKAGISTVDIITNEDLGTGSTYADTDMDGMSIGVGYNATNDNGMFLRVEGNYMEFDGASVTSANGVNKISLDSLDGASGKLSIGKSF